MRNMQIIKAIAAMLLMLAYTNSYTQDARAAQMYSGGEYEKCLKRTESILAKQPRDVYALYYTALCYWEMDQLPGRYRHIGPHLIEEGLKALGKLARADAEGIFFAAHADTLALIREYSEEIANTLASSNKTRSVRMYGQLIRAFGSHYSPLKIAEIYFMADDFDNGFRTIERLYASAKEDISPQSDPQMADALSKGLPLLLRFSMFNNAYYIIELYKPKFENNEFVSSSFFGAAVAALERLAPASDKNLFFSYTDRSLRIYGQDKKFREYLYNLYMKILGESEQKFAAIEKPESWRDSVPLRDFFQYSAICYSIFPLSQIKENEERVTAKYNLEPEQGEKSELQLAFKTALAEIRDNQAVCATGLMPGQNPLTYSIDLSQAALWMAKDMFAFNYTDTTDRQGRSTLGRVHETGLKPYRFASFHGVSFFGATEASECVAYHWPIGAHLSGAELENLLQNLLGRWTKGRNGDCERIMAPQYTHYGFGVFGDRYSLVLAKIIDQSD
jgi:uncharacterized protein YkwD